MLAYTPDVALHEHEGSACDYAGQRLPDSSRPSDVLYMAPNVVSTNATKTASFTVRQVIRAHQRTSAHPLCPSHRKRRRKRRVSVVGPAIDAPISVPALYKAIPLPARHSRISCHRFRDDSVSHWPIPAPLRLVLCGASTGGGAGGDVYHAAHAVWYTSGTARPRCWRGLRVARRQPILRRGQWIPWT